MQIIYMFKIARCKRLALEPEAFRSEANTVLQALYQRMRREDTELYPAVEAI